MKTTTRVLAFLGIICLLGALILSLSNGLGFGDGNRISCTVNVDASLTGSLDINSATCNIIGSCSTISPFSIFNWPFQQDGSVSIWAGGKAWGSESVSENSLDPTGTNYGVGACVPKGTGQVTIKAVSKSGGTDDTEVVTFA